MDSPCGDQALRALGPNSGGSPSGPSSGGFSEAPSSATCSSAARCGCTGVYQANPPYSNADRCTWIEQLDLSGASKGRGTGAGGWNADVFLDCVNKQISVTHKIRYVNLTGAANYGNGATQIAAPLSTSAFTARSSLIGPGIQAWWNAKPYRVRIKDRVCGEHIYTIFFNPEQVTSGEHYAIDLYNVPYNFRWNGGVAQYQYFVNGDRRRPLPWGSALSHPKSPSGSLGRSWVRQGNPYEGSWNLADSRTCTDHNHAAGADMLEPHEFAHMIGLRDAYREASRNINGLRFHTRGDLGSTADDYTVTGTANTSHPGMLGSMRNTADYHKAYALTVVFVVIRHMNQVWGMPVEDWEIQR